MTFEIQPKWRTTSNTEAHFAAGRSGLRGAEEIHDLFVPVLDEIDNEGYNWADLDVDGWGEIDHLVRTSNTVIFLDPQMDNSSNVLQYTGGHSLWIPSRSW